jgi:hypothetical protein
MDVTEWSRVESCNKDLVYYLSPAPSQFAIDAISDAMTAQQCGQREHFERSQLRAERNAGTSQTYRDGISGRIFGMGSTGGNAYTRPVVSDKNLKMTGNDV